MKRWIGPIAVAIAVATVPALLRASTPPNYAIQMIGQPLNLVMDEAEKMAFLSVEACHRAAIDAVVAGRQVPKDSCDQLAKAAEAYAFARTAVVRMQFEQKK